MENITDFDISGLEAMNRKLKDSVLYMTIIVAILGITGFLGNLCVLIVYYFNYPRCNFRCFVITLAIIDIISCLTTIPGEIFAHRHWFNYPDNAIWFCKVKTYFNGFTVFVQAFNLFLIAVDRFRKTCHPLKWQIKPKRATQLSLISFLIASVFSTPASFLWGKQTANVTFQGRNVTIQMCEKDDNFKNTVYPSIFVNFIFFLPVVWFMISTGVLYALILQKMFCGSIAKSEATFSMEISTTATSFESNIQKNNLENKASNAARVQTEEEFYDSEENTPRLSRKHQLHSILREINPRKRHLSSKARMQTKTLIMFILTVVFFVTTMTYFAILSLVAAKDQMFVLEAEDKSGVLFLFWRLYFINHVINPVIYCFLDHRFIQALKLGTYTKQSNKWWMPSRHWGDWIYIKNSNKFPWSNKCPPQSGHKDCWFFFFLFFF